MSHESPYFTIPRLLKPFVLYTDASGTGLGAVLSQKDDENRERVIAYASRSLNKTEQNYGITDKECLAVIWAIKHFEQYLGLLPFQVVTDHSALKYLQTAKMPTGRRARWIMYLQQFDFEITYRPGKENKNADALFRTPEIVECNFVGVETQEEEIEETPTTIFQNETSEYDGDSESEEDETVECIFYNQHLNSESVKRGLEIEELLTRFIKKRSIQGKGPSKKRKLNNEVEFNVAPEEEISVRSYSCCGEIQCICYEALSNSSSYDDNSEMDEEDNTHESFEESYNVQHQSESEMWEEEYYREEYRDEWDGIEGYYEGTYDYYEPDP